MGGLICYVALGQKCVVGPLLTLPQYKAHSRLHKAASLFARRPETNQWSCTGIILTGSRFSERIQEGPSTKISKLLLINFHLIDYINELANHLSSTLKLLQNIANECFITGLVYAFPPAHALIDTNTYPYTHEQ